MRFLLDTHCWLWWLFESHKLSQTAQTAIQSFDNELWLSVASIWEIGIKYKIGKLQLPQKPEIFIPQQMQIDQLQHLSITLQHTIQASDLPLYHKDPFDRMIIAQTQLEGLTLLTQDTKFDYYDVSTLW